MAVAMAEITTMATVYPGPPASGKGVHNSLARERSRLYIGWRVSGNGEVLKRMIFADNLGVPEGPVALADGKWLVVEMEPERGCVTLLDREGRVERVIARTGRPNGLAVDADGTIWVAESKEPSLIRLSMDGQAEVILTECDGEPFLFPNDLCFGPDGTLYMTTEGLRLYS